MTLQPKIDRITDILRRDDGISGAMHYTEQISWILFLKFLSDYEENKADEAKLSGGKYEYVLDQEHRWHNWACPQTEDGKPDYKKCKTGDDLKKYIDNELFPYLKNFKNEIDNVKSVKYKIGSIFEYLDNRIANGQTIREVLDIINELNFQSEQELFELSHIYENLLIGMGSDGGNSGEFYTPRSVIKAIVQTLKPKVGQTVYDGAAGSCGFLVEAYEYMKEQPNLSVSEWKKLHEDTFYGNEKTPLAYVMGVMNMILHGIESPNIYKANTLTKNIADIEEKDRYDIILANPPFGGKEKSQIQQNFSVQANATELLFLQHFMKSLKLFGKAAIVIPEGVLFQTGPAFKSVKQDLLENFNLHTILSLPPGVFLPYSGVKTNVIFFERNGDTPDIWYYEINTPFKLAKNRPLEYEHVKDFIELYDKRTESENSWIVKADKIKELDYDISAKNPNRKEDIAHLPPDKVLEKIKENDEHINSLVDEIEEILSAGSGSK